MEEPSVTSASSPEPTPRKSRAIVQNTPEKRRRNPLWVVVAVLGVVIVAILGWLFWSQQQKTTGIDSSKYQAVFLSNGQHYFGKLTVMSDDYFKLSDVYYLEQANKTDSETNANTVQQTQVELRKLGEKEIHGPEDTMIISRDQVLLYENLTDKSQVVKSIDQQKQQAK